MNRYRSLATAALVAAVLLTVGPASGQRLASAGCGTAVHVGEARGFVLFPEGDLFCSLLADPKAERSFLSSLHGRFATLAEGDEAIHIGAVGLGDRFALMRWGGSREGDGLQIGLVGSIFAQFDLNTESFDLINADYIVGLPLTVRRGASSARLKLFHQSSHLGDEYLLRGELERENLSFEALELILSHEFHPIRLYGGGEYLFNREPATLEPLLVHAGAELRVGDVRGPHLVGAADVKSSEQQEWKPAWSVRAGVEIAHWRDEGHPPRLWSLLAEFYNGPSPYGQFFRENIRYLGLGLHFSL
jgi:hypothetical protein